MAKHSQLVSYQSEQEGNTQLLPLGKNYYTVTPCYPKGLVPGRPQIPKSEDAPVPYIKWRSTAGPPHPWMQSTRIWRADGTGLGEPPQAQNKD